MIIEDASRDRRTLCTFGILSQRPFGVSLVRCTIGNPHLEAFGAPLRTTWGRLGDILGILGGHFEVAWGFGSAL